MSTRIEQILRLARQTLGDKDKDRWSDPDLLDLLDLGHKDYAHHARILRGVHEIPLIDGQAIYTVPDDIFMVLRAEYNTCNLFITTYDAMDEQGRKLLLSSYRNSDRDYRDSRVNSDFNSGILDVCWQQDTSSMPEAVIFDKSNMNEFRVYPIPKDQSNDIEYTFENESGVELPFVGAELYGLVTAIDDYTFDQEEGVVTDLYDPQISAESFNSVNGVVTGMGESSNSIIIRYIKTPDTIDSVADDLLTPRAFDQGLKYYIVGHALRNDLDARNVERGNQELMFYERELQLAAEVASSSAVKNVAPRTTTFRSPFE